MSQIIFRLKTDVKVVGIDEPTTINPTIDEPVKWSDVPMVGECDPKYLGFNYHYSDGDLKLDFTCENSHALLSAQYYTYGTDAFVQFMVIEVARDGTETIEYDGKIDFETIDIQPGRVSASIITNDNHDKTNARWESPIALNSKLTLDNVAIDPTQVTQIPLYGQTIHETGEFQNQGKTTEYRAFSGSEGFDLGGSFYLLPKTYLEIGGTTPVVSSSTTPALDTLSGVDLLAGDIYPLNITEPPPFLTVTESTAGAYHLEIDWLFTLNAVLSKNSLLAKAPQFAILRFEPVLIVRKPNVDPQTIFLCDPRTGDGYVNSVEHQLPCAYKGDFDFPVGTRAYLFTKIVAFSVKSIKQIEFYVETVNIRVLIDRKTRAAPTITKAYLLPDALRHVLGAITSNVDNATKTGNVYGGLIDKAHTGQALDGYATEYAITTGLLLRGLTKAATFTAKDLMQTLWSQHRAGMLYEKDLTTGEQKIRIEEGAWFYRGGEIAVIDEVFEYSEDPDLDLLFNQIIVGYDKYPESGPGVADEFNTQHTYQTPLISRQSTLDILCPLIAAGTAIEEARRLGIKKVIDGKEVSTTSDAGSYDDDGFILHVAPLTHADHVTFIIVQPTPDKPYVQHYIQFSNAVINGNSGGVLLYYGDLVTFSGTGTANDGVAYKMVGFRIGSPVPFSEHPTYEFDPTTPMVATGEIPVNWQIGAAAVKLRTNERLTVTSVTDPETAYNLELSPARMLRRHAPFINSGLFYKQAIDKLRCTAFKQSAKVTTQVKTGVNPLPGDSAMQLIRETGDISLGDLEGFIKLFQPELIKAKVRIDRATRRKIFAALKNQGPIDLRMGYLTIKNADGDFVSGYVKSINYTDSSEVADLVLSKRRPDADPNAPNCFDYYDWVYNQFQGNPNADPNIYRFCRFRDFAPA